LDLLVVCEEGKPPTLLLGTDRLNLFLFFFLFLALLAGLIVSAVLATSFSTAIGGGGGGGEGGVEGMHIVYGFLLEDSIVFVMFIGVI
jgi:hypothetical protein